VPVAFYSRISASLGYGLPRGAKGQVAIEQVRWQEMTSLTNVVIAGGDAEAAVARVETLSPAGYAGLAVSNGLDVQQYVIDRQPELVLFEGPFKDVDTFEVARRLKDDPATRHVPVIMLNGENSPEMRYEALESGLDDLIVRDTPDEIVLARLLPFVRLSTMHAECIRRVETASEFRVAIDLADVHRVSTKNSRVLLIGGDNPGVESVAEALEMEDFTVSRETSHFAAGERLAEDTYDAAVIAVDRTESIENAYFLCAHIRNNTRLFNLPVLLAVASEAVLGSDQPYRQGASATASLNRDYENLAMSLKFLVRRQRLRWNLHAPLTATLQASTSDRLQGLYSTNFLNAHLNRLLERVQNRRRRTISAAIFSLQNLSNAEKMYGSDAGEQLLQQAADCVSGMIRVEDLAARLSPIEICAVFPDTSERDARQAADRITGVLQHSEFTLTGARNATTWLWTQSGVATSEQGDTMDSLIGRVRNNLA
jgi:two-component system cell cycle response regulator